MPCRSSICAGSPPTIRHLHRRPRLDLGAFRSTHLSGLYALVVARLYSSSYNYSRFPSFLFIFHSFVLFLLLFFFFSPFPLLPSSPSSPSPTRLLLARPTNLPPVSLLHVLVILTLSFALCDPPIFLPLSSGTSLEPLLSRLYLVARLLCRRPLLDLSTAYLFLPFFRLPRASAFSVPSPTPTFSIAPRHSSVQRTPISSALPPRASHRASRPSFRPRHGGLRHHGHAIFGQSAVPQQSSRRLPQFHAGNGSA